MEHIERDFERLRGAYDREPSLKQACSSTTTIVCAPESFKFALNVLHFLQAPTSRQAILLLEDNISKLSSTKLHELMRQNGWNNFRSIVHRVAFSNNICKASNQIDRASGDALDNR
jgi:hypothetical protein